jgi:hypothetical protein
MAANVTILTDEDCQQRFSPHYTIYPGMICAGGKEKDACQVKNNDYHDDDKY